MRHLLAEMSKKELVEQASSVVKNFRRGPDAPILDPTYKRSNLLTPQIDPCLKLILQNILLLKGRKLNKKFKFEKSA